MNEKIQFEYGAYDDYLRECYEKFGGILELPVIKSPYDEMKEQYQRGNILDLGAGKKKPLQEVMKGKIKEGKYYSLDTDPQGEFDFHDTKDIPADLQFDMVTANQVFEHLTVDESIELLTQTQRVLKQNGKVIATVPNIAHPNRQISNVTHRTPWGHHSFYALFRMAGLDVVKIVRYTKRAPKGSIEKIFAYYMNNIYRIDWCDSILLVAMKK